MTGVYRIDEAALKRLPEHQLGELCRQGALALAYAQLLSESRLDTRATGYVPRRNV